MDLHVLLTMTSELKVDPPSPSDTTTGPHLATEGGTDTGVALQAWLTVRDHASVAVSVSLFQVP